MLDRSLPRSSVVVINEESLFLEEISWEKILGHIKKFFEPFEDFFGHFFNPNLKREPLEHLEVKIH